jgi:hypothetical protein
LGEWVGRAILEQDTSKRTTITDLTIGDFIENFDRLSVPTLTMEGRIIVYLAANGLSRIKEVMIASGGSYRGFYLAMNRLIDKGVVVVSHDPKDKRARLASLANARI